MDLKIPSAMVERQILPKHTKSTEIGSGLDAMIANMVGSSTRKLEIRIWLGY